MKTRLLCLVVFAYVSTFVCSQNQTPEKAPSVLHDFDQALEEVAERAMRSVVEIDVTGYGAPEHDEDSSQLLHLQRSLGSGVIVDPDGYIVTNNHVVAGAMRIRVILAPATVEIVPYHTSLARKQRVYDAKLVGTNRYADLAVLKIEEKNLPFISLPDELYRVHLGQTVLAIGSPEGLDHTLTKGIVSAVGRQPDLDRPMVYIQTDAPINPGNSGGPLLDSSGRLIGVTTAILSPSGSNAGIGFAIPVDIVNRIVPELIRNGRVPTPGIGILVASDAAASQLGTDGVIIARVLPGSPAARAGLRGINSATGALGDVIVGANGAPVHRLADLTDQIQKVGIGHKIDLQIARDDHTVAVSVGISDTSKPAEAG